MEKRNLRWLRALAVLLVGLATTLTWGAFGQQVRGRAVPSSPAALSQKVASQEKMKEVAGKLPLYFIENRGQTNSRVGYYIQGRNNALYFTPQGVTFALTGTARQRQIVKMDFLDANPNVKPMGRDLTPAVFSYFKGPKAEWKTGLKTYARVVYADLWDGIDLVYSGNTPQLKYEFLVKPGADPKQIQLAYRGATAVKRNDAGQLEVSTPAGNFRDDKPYTYQEVDGRRIEIPASYDVKFDTYGFRVGDYDRSKPLVIDPAVLIYCGYIGGAGEFNSGLGADEAGNGIAVDSAGNAYITGTTNSAPVSYPETLGPDLTWSGDVDAFVAKVKADGTGLIYCGYIGGSSWDVGFGIAVDSAGNAYVTGYTSSSPLQGFPATVGPDLTYNGDGDAFVAKVKADGTGFAYCGYIGGGVPNQVVAADVGYGIAVDSLGNAYVTGATSSSDFPAAGGMDTTYNGGSGDAFVTKVKADGTVFDYSGYVGGSGDEYGSGIAVDSAGNAYITGRTNSADFPTLIGPDTTFDGGMYDAFIVKVKSNGTGFDYAGYFGYSGNDQGRGIAVDGLGRAYITGFSDGDAFVAKVDTAGASFVYLATIAKGQGNGIAVDSGGQAYIAGSTESSELDGFPVTGGPDLTYNGGLTDAFVAKLNASGTALLYCGYIGGINREKALSIVVDAAGNAYITGFTSSNPVDGFPLTVGPDLTFNGGNTDAFVAKVGVVTDPPTPSSADLSVEQTVSVQSTKTSRTLISTVTVKNHGPDGAYVVLNYQAVLNSKPPVPQNNVVVYKPMPKGDPVPLPYTITENGIRIELGHLSGKWYSENSITVLIGVLVDQSGLVTSTAYVPPKTPKSDPNLSNNTSTVTTLRP